MPHHQRHILAFNDSTEVLSVLKELLEEEGYRVTTHARLISDLAEIRELAPDLMILDYMWADEDAGWAALQLLRLDPEIGKVPLILCTGAKREVTEIASHLTAMGVQVVLKRFDIDTLLEAVAAALPPLSAAT